MGQGGARRQAEIELAAVISSRSIAVVPVPERPRTFMKSSRTMLLDPGDPALNGRSRHPGHHQAKVRRNESGFSTSIAAPQARCSAPTHGITAPPDENIGGLVDLGSQIFSLLFHPHPRPGCRPNRKASGKT